MKRGASWVAQGKAALSNKLVRAGRSMQSSNFITESSSDLLDSSKSNIGLKFAFHSTDGQIRNTLRSLELDRMMKENQKCDHGIRNWGNV